MIDEDMSAFFNTDEFARTFTRGAGTPQEVSFAAIFSVIDAESLQGYALNADFEINYPSEAVTLRKDDVLTDGGGQGYAPGTLWKVREHPKRAVDGQESHAPLALYTL